jgi:hypothetical protein
VPKPIEDNRRCGTEGRASETAMTTEKRNFPSATLTLD